MKKIRINELARELEVKPGVILDMLPELGVQEKKTHSSSIDEDVALVVKERLTGSGAPPQSVSNGHHAAPDHEIHEAHEPQELPVSEEHEEHVSPAAAAAPPLEARAAAGVPPPEPLQASAISEHPQRPGFQPPVRPIIREPRASSSDAR